MAASGVTPRPEMMTFFFYFHGDTFNVKDLVPLG